MVDLVLARLCQRRPKQVVFEGFGGIVLFLPQGFLPGFPSDFPLLIFLGMRRSLRKCHVDEAIKPRFECHVANSIEEYSVSC